MKLVSFETEGRASYGAVVGERIVDLGRTHGDTYPTLAAYLGSGELERAGASIAGTQGDLALGDVTLKSPIPNPAKMIGLGLNYRKHIVESGRDIPQYPMLFTRYADSMVGHDEPMIVPKASAKLDYEGELPLSSPALQDIC